MYSSDNGATWSAPIAVAAETSTFIRNVQITGDLGTTGHVYVAGMDEMGGGLTNRANKIYRSTDGGNTWTNTFTGAAFPAPGLPHVPTPTSPACFPTAVATGGTWAGVSLRRSTA